MTRMKLIHVRIRKDLLEELRREGLLGAGITVQKYRGLQEIVNLALDLQKRTRDMMAESPGKMLVEGVSDAAQDEP